MRRSTTSSGVVLQPEAAAVRPDSLRSTSVIGMSPTLALTDPRFIRMASDSSTLEKTVVFADPPGTNNFIAAPVPIAELNNDIMDVAFTKAVGCVQYPGGCDGLRKDHRFADAVPLGENWRHKYLIDIDGMGYSARLFALVS